MSSCCGPSRGSGPLGGHASAVERQVLRRLASAASTELALVGLAGGRFRMGSEDPLAYPDDGEGPVRWVEVAPFAISATAVTVAEFAAFVLETGYRTEAEVHGNSLVFSGLLSEHTRKSSPSVAATPWWHQVTGASWFNPAGPDSDDLLEPNHPVTHVSHQDAVAYADWVGARLPEEPEWEFAARGGLDQQPYPWGGIREPDGKPRMNTFQGDFPHRPCGPVGPQAVDAHSPNGYGLHNMTGNVWEWTTGNFAPGDHRPVMRGGSYLCHESYCRRYRTSARSTATADTSLGHTGFRLALSTE
ncbi:formylglycine-generating enzyme family protein [Nesterenkonia salmonea]|uniref:Formylglycine-generating enzyme family protein n=1 Tax=Nesterenkonia salmonea TaxID=1804987 RepID=A0A5R9BDJ4_9MICC|nr:formylglycine-generating enzyme family protein [Nesterenkonia salmonea]TLP98648.1 formylglycine-generating enzyme family protein [Nesterenkonia salmonea]